MRSFFLAAACAVLAACDSNPTSIAPAVGIFNLVTVDGVPVPARGATSIAARGSIELGGDSDYDLVQIDSALTGGTTTEFRSSGQWQLENNALMLRDGSTLIFGAMSGDADTLRIVLRGQTNVYARR
jgi:hypothetical protein